MPKKKNKFDLESLSQRMTNSIGTTSSMIIHTLLFVGIFALRFFNISTEEILLILTTAVSLEAIYLAIFIQMTVNRTTISLANVEEDIDDIQGDVDSLESNIKEISDDYIDDDTDETEVVSTLKDIETRLKDLQGDIAILKKKGLF